MAVTKRIRFEVLRRDNFTCRYCGASAPDATLTVDHVTPVALGGSDTADNLVAACRDCNYGKASTKPDEGVVEDVAHNAAQWARALGLAAERMRADEDSFERFRDDFLSGWNRWVPVGIDSTLRALHDAGLPGYLVRESAEIACAARGIEDRRAYFGGVAWRRVRQMQDLAREIVESEAESGS